jgi:hypothetical protein
MEPAGSSPRSHKPSTGLKQKKFKWTFQHKKGDDEELHKLSPLHGIIGRIVSSGMRWEGH